jgi:hypothetical protein
MYIRRSLICIIKVYLLTSEMTVVKGQFWNTHHIRWFDTCDFSVIQKLKIAKKISHFEVFEDTQIGMMT